MNNPIVKDSASSNQKSVAVIGTGYVGLTTACCLASFGHKVACFDANTSLLEHLSTGKPHIYEKGINELLSAGLSSGHLKFVSSFTDAVRTAKFIFVCVGTPSLPTGAVDVSSIETVFDNLARESVSEPVVILRSTVPIGMSSKLINRYGSSIGKIVFMPEFLREGAAVHDFLNPTRIIVGSRTAPEAELVLSLFEKVCAPKIIVSLNAAETIKYGSNALLATKISFINSLATLCDATDSDIREVALGIGLDPRIGPDFLKSGPGWGGSCFPKDLMALKIMGDECGVRLEIVEAAIESNRTRMAYVSAEIVELMRSANATVIGFLGLAFKAGTNDIRESPAVIIANSLIALGFEVVAYDPQVSIADHPSSSIRILPSLRSLLETAEIAAVMTEWDEFVKIDELKAAKTIKTRVVVDTRGIVETDSWELNGIQVRQLGAK